MGLFGVVSAFAGNGVQIYYLDPDNRDFINFDCITIYSYNLKSFDMAIQFNRRMAQLAIL